MLDGIFVGKLTVTEHFFTENSETNLNTTKTVHSRVTAHDPVIRNGQSEKSDGSKRLLRLRSTTLLLLQNLLHNLLLLNQKRTHDPGSQQSENSVGRESQ